MTSEQVIETEQKPKYYCPSIERLRLILMFFMCIDLLGFPTQFGDFVKTVCGFVPLAFFIISGYLVLRESPNRSKRIVRSIKRTAIVFGILFVVYFVLNFFYYLVQGLNIFSSFLQWRFWFNFLVMNVWQYDIGKAIWYVQALLYAYIIIYFLDKWKLLKYDWLISLLLILFTIFTGELAGVFTWQIMGYSYLVGNFLTRALPYILLGCFIHRKLEFFLKIKFKWYIYSIIIGIILSVGEILLLGILGRPGYYGHLVGMIPIAASVCLIAFMEDNTSGFEKILKMSRWHTNIIYYICQPMSVFLALRFTTLGQADFAQIMPYVGIITFVICFFIAWGISFISRRIKNKKQLKTNEDNN